MDYRYNCLVQAFKAENWFNENYWLNEELKSGEVEVEVFFGTDKHLFVCNKNKPNFKTEKELTEWLEEEGCAGLIRIGFADEEEFFKKLYEDNAKKKVSITAKIKEKCYSMKDETVIYVYNTLLTITRE